MGRPQEAQNNGMALSSDEPPPTYKTAMGEPKNPSEASSSAGTSQTIQIPRQFPPAFNLYRGPWGTSSFTLGEHQNQPLYVYVWHSGFSNSPPVVLHSGPHQGCPPLASARWRMFQQTFDVELPPVPGSGAPFAREEIEAVRSGFHPATYRFSIEVGPNNVRETFEWRRSRSDAVLALNGESGGYKLVRLSHGPPGGGGASGNMNFVQGGYTGSDGNEVVAAWSMNIGSATKVAKFHFTGTGLTGLLGERWAIVAVVTACALYQRVRRQRSSAASS